MCVEMEVFRSNAVYDEAILSLLTVCCMFTLLIQQY